MLVILATMISTRAAQAHSTLITACPPPDEVTSRLDTIELRFSDPLDTTATQPPHIALAPHESSTSITIGPTTIVGLDTLVVTVLNAPTPGTYTVRYEVLSFDGTLSEGGYQFTYSPAAGLPDDCSIEPARVVTVEADESNAGIWLAVGSGVVALLAVGLWLRQRGTG